MSVVGVLRGEEHEGARRMLIPTWVRTDRWTGDTRGWGSPHLSSFLPPPPTAPLSLARWGPSSRLFFFAPHRSGLYPFLWDRKPASLWVSDPTPHFWLSTYLPSASFLRTSVPLSLILWPLLSLDLYQPLLGSLSLPLWVSDSLLLGLCPLSLGFYPWVSPSLYLFSVSVAQSVNLKLKRIGAHWSLSLRRVKLGGRSHDVLGL